MKSMPDLFSHDEWVMLARHLRLAPRQEQTLRGLLEGLSDKQIALKLGIAESTVRSYLQRLYMKCGVQDRTALVVYVFCQFRTNVAAGVDQTGLSEC